jgi:formylglycine-generating enzyme required for sulfatase activity
MKRYVALALALCAVFVVPLGNQLPVAFGQEATAFAKKNGDVNGDGTRNLSDAVALLDWLFLSGPAPAQLEAATRVAELEGALTAATKRIKELEAFVEEHETIEDFERIGRNPQGYMEYKHLKTRMTFVRLPGGTFRMGNSDLECAGGAHERPVHDVAISSFLISKYECTQDQWLRTVGTEPWSFAGPTLPVETVSRKDIRVFEQVTGLALPSESQWEYACRAGTTTHFAFGDTITRAQANFFAAFISCGSPAGKSLHRTVPVDSYEPNPFGLYNMHGNVAEWCVDIYDAEFYDQPAAAGPDPVSFTGSEYTSFRGGSWANTAANCRSAVREWDDEEYNDEFIGFRPIFPLP